MTDTRAIEAAIEKVIAANPQKVEEVKAKPKLDRLVCRSGDERDRRQGQSGRQVNAVLKTRLGIARRGVICTFTTILTARPRRSRQINPYTDERIKANKTLGFMHFAKWAMGVGGGCGIASLTQATHILSVLGVRVASTRKRKRSCLHANDCKKEKAG